jgi:hypothetical protein
MKLLNWVSDNWRKYDIIKVVDGEEVLYLRRYFLWRSRWFNIYLHHIPRPDEDRDPHDHPWSFVSVLLRGGYDEEVFNTKRELIKTNKRKAFAIGKRSGNVIHQITRVDPNTWTLVFTSSRWRKWGFITKDGWVYWKTYLGIPDNNEVEMD